jgi:hypothetical protein
MGEGVGIASDELPEAIVLDQSNPDEMLLNEVQKHLVGIVCIHEPTTPDDSFPQGIYIASGFVLEIDSIWFIATAGHVFEDINRMMKDYPTRRYTFWLADGFAHTDEPCFTVPLDYHRAEKNYWHDEETGLDFGMIALYSNTQRMLSENHVIPAYEHHFVDSEGRFRNMYENKFVAYKMFGLVGELVQQKGKNSASITATILNLRKIDVPSSLQRFTQPTFFAEIKAMDPLKSIKEMSGCPILGFSFDEDNQLRYYFLAIQSGWLKDRDPKVIYACDLPSLAKNAIIAVRSRTGVSPK